MYPVPSTYPVPWPPMRCCLRKPPRRGPPSHRTLRAERWSPHPCPELRPPPVRLRRRSPCPRPRPALHNRTARRPLRASRTPGNPRTRAARAGDGGPRNAKHAGLGRRRRLRGIGNRDAPVGRAPKREHGAGNDQRAEAEPGRALASLDHAGASTHHLTSVRQRCSHSPAWADSRADGALAGYSDPASPASTDVAASSPGASTPASLAPEGTRLVATSSRTSVSPGLPGCCWVLSE
jgi:hypothetical protein